MLRSIPSMGHVIMLLSLLLYVYAVLGFYLFRDADAEHWGTLGAALLTLFRGLPAAAPARSEPAGRGSV